MVNLTGQQFGRLTALRKTDKRKNGSIVWECKCSCGNKAFVKSGSLKSGHTKSCGCLSCKNKDLTNQRFGNLIAIKKADPPRKTHRSGYWWLCICDCGKEKTVLSVDLRGKNVKSCGCLHKKVHFNRRMEKGCVSLNRHMKTYKHAAKKRNLDWQLTKESFKILVESNCFYCQIEPSQKVRENELIFLYNGIDRIDNTKGYLVENCIPCCKDCNYAKNKQTITEFKNWICRLAKNIENIKNL